LLALIGIAGAGTAAFLHPPIERLPPASAPPTAPPAWALPPDRVVVLVPDGSRVPAPWPFARPIDEGRLRAAGLLVVHTPGDLARAVEDGGVVIWLHRDAVPLVDADWVRARYREGHPVGVIGGTMAELWAWFGIGPRDGGGFLRPGSPVPAFALADSRSCGGGPGGQTQQRLGTSEHFSLDWLVSVSRDAALFCAR
jgi:hypothetical protein